MRIDETLAVSRSFAGGSINVRNANTTAANGAGIWAGGIVGRKISGQLNRTAHVGRNLTGGQVNISAQGGIARNVGRIFGVSEGTVPANNYASNAIFVGEHADYWVFSIPLAIVPGTPTAASQHGANATNAQFSSSAFWTTAPMSFGSVWRFNGVSQGWPSLANVGGQ